MFYLFLTFLIGSVGILTGCVTKSDGFTPSSIADSGTISFYVNGVLNNSGISGVGNITTDFSKFGVIPSTAGPGQEFDGTLDEIRITNTILSSAQVKAEFKFQNNQNNSNVSFGSIESNP